MIAPSPLAPADAILTRNAAVPQYRTSLASSNVPQVAAQSTTSHQVYTTTSLPKTTSPTTHYLAPKPEMRDYTSPLLSSRIAQTQGSFTQSQTYQPSQVNYSSLTQTMPDGPSQNIKYSSYTTQTTERYVSKGAGDVPSALHASTAAPTALKVGPHQSENLIGPNPLYSQYVSMPPSRAYSGLANSYVANSQNIPHVDPLAYRAQSPPPLITTASAGHMRPSESPLAFTTVTYAKNGSVAGGTTTSPYETSHRASVVHSHSNSQKVFKHEGPRFVRKHRGACAGCNETANAAFDANGGKLGWLNCGCCDRPQKVPVAIDYSPQAHLN